MTASTDRAACLCGQASCWGPVGQSRVTGPLTPQFPAGRLASSARSPAQTATWREAGDPPPESQRRDRCFLQSDSVCLFPCKTQPTGPFDEQIKLHRTLFCSRSPEWAGFVTLTERTHRTYVGGRRSVPSFPLGDPSCPHAQTRQQPREGGGGRFRVLAPRAHGGAQGRAAQPSLPPQAPSSFPTSSSSSPVASRCSSWRWRWASTPAKGASQPGGRSVPSSRVSAPSQPAPVSPRHPPPCALHLFNSATPLLCCVPGDTGGHREDGQAWRGPRRRALPRRAETAFRKHVSAWLAPRRTS